MTAIGLSLLMLLAQQRDGRWRAAPSSLAGPPQGSDDAPIVETLGCLTARITKCS